MSSNNTPLLSHSSDGSEVKGPLPAVTVQETNRSWKKNVDSPKMNQIVTQIPLAVLGCGFIVEQINPSPGTFRVLNWHVLFFLVSDSNDHQKQFPFSWQGH